MDENIIYDSLGDLQYREYIVYIVNRIIDEDQFVIEGNRQNGRVVFAIKIKQCEWYRELDDYVKYDVEVNLKRHIFRHFASARSHYTVCRGNGILANNNSVLDYNNRNIVKI